MSTPEPLAACRSASSTSASPRGRRPILAAVLHRLSQGGRRVDADDLVALAAVLGVTPAMLLAPPGEVPGDPLPEHAAAAAARQLAARIGDPAEAAGDPAVRKWRTGKARARKCQVADELCRARAAQEQSVRQ